MSGYLATWIQYEKEKQAIRDAHPERADCNGFKDCPSDEHWGACGKQRRIWYPELYAKIDRQARERRQANEP